MIKNSQKWYILDLLMTGMFFYMLCLPKEHPHMFFLGSRMFVIYYKSKYSSDMFYD